MQTSFDFELPRGFVDANGKVHRAGTMRLATARDEILPLVDERYRMNPAFLSIVLLGRVVTKLGNLPRVDGDIIEGLFASDLAFLQDLYKRINREGHTRANVTCPNCEHTFTVDMAGGSSGGS